MTVHFVQICKNKNNKIKISLNKVYILTQKHMLLRVYNALELKVNVYVNKNNVVLYFDLILFVVALKKSNTSLKAYYKTIFSALIMPIMHCTILWIINHS